MMLQLGIVEIAEHRFRGSEVHGFIVVRPFKPMRLLLMAINARLATHISGLSIGWQCYEIVGEQIASHEQHECHRRGEDPTLPGAARRARDWGGLRPFGSRR